MNLDVRILVCLNRTSKKPAFDRVNVNNELTPLEKPNVTSTVLVLIAFLSRSAWLGSLLPNGSHSATARCEPLKSADPIGGVLWLVENRNCIVKGKANVVEMLWKCFIWEVTSENIRRRFVPANVKP